MARGTGLQSLFAQKLDRALFAIYFLGAIVPLVVVGYLVHQFALPAVESDSLATAIVLGTFCGVSVLSLASFFALRRLSLSAVTRMDADNERLAAILKASRELTTAPHLHAAAEIAAGYALRLTGADAVLVLRKSDAGKPLELCELAGKFAARYFDQNQDDIQELAELTIAGEAGSETGAVGNAVGVSLRMVADAGVPGVMLIVRAPVGGKTHEAFQPEVIDSVATLASLAAVAMQSSDLKDSQQNFFSHATEILVMALDGHDARQGEGAHHVAQIANRLGRELGLDDELLRRLHFGALLADIGILKMTAQQQQSAQHHAKHPAIGHRILSRIRLWESLATIVLHHHDDFDGSGGEDGLVGEAIPLESRIIHAADAYAELTRAGGNRMQLTPSGAVAELATSAGSRFDPAVVAAFEKLSERGEL
jgi:hypothetical protein